MLQLKNITKSYTTGDFTQVALNDVSLNFRKAEFVAILGQSGSGKTTCLNVIGGLDKYDSGDLIINGKSTKDFKTSEWDAYRNNSIGFVFQSYNLISHLTLVDNVEMSMTLSGVSHKERRQKALEVLEKVGLKEHINKKPNQLSGGQMQRVAIARAIANNPDIIMMDEPTGALDSQTSIQIMELIKDIAKDKLCIMVTHNPELAQQYADRIINFKDGKVVGDSNPYDEYKTDDSYKLKKTKMSYLTALKLSGKNIATKKWRTILTSFASSIGIIGIALILSLSNGFKIQIDKFQSDTMKDMPVTISQTSMSVDKNSLIEMRGDMLGTGKDDEYTAEKKVYLYDPESSKVLHKNKITQEYMDYLKKIDTNVCNSIGYMRFVGMNLLAKNDGKVEPVNLSIGINSASNGPEMMMDTSAGQSSYPETITGEGTSYLENNYDVLSGSYPQDINEMVLVVDKKNKLSYTVLKNLGFDVSKDEEMNFDDIVGKEFKLVNNNDFYVKTALGNYVPNTDYDKVYNSKDNMTLKISGIVRVKESTKIGLLGSGIVYSDKLVEKIIDNNINSDIVKAQKDSDKNVITMQPIEENDKKTIITSLGGDTLPYAIFLYPETFEQKDKLIEYLDNYNSGKEEENQIVYTDMAATMSDMTSSIMDAITIVLIAFASISLVVSLIMVGIITYISVLERTKEIGILRALGARKRDIANVFNAETFIIGATSGILGIGIAYLLTLPTNVIILKMTELPNVAQLNPLHAVLLVTISIILTLIGGAIPAKMAAKKDPVTALRTE